MHGKKKRQCPNRTGRCYPSGSPDLQSAQTRGLLAVTYLAFFSSVFAFVLLLAVGSPFGMPASLTSTLDALILYLIVTLEPFFRSPVTLVFLSRPISHFSLPFWTVITSSVRSSTGPVT